MSAKSRQTWSMVDPWKQTIRFGDVNVEILETVANEFSLVINCPRYNHTIWPYKSALSAKRAVKRIIKSLEELHANKYRSDTDTQHVSSGFETADLVVSTEHLCEHGANTCDACSDIWSEQRRELVGEVARLKNRLAWVNCKSTTKWIVQWDAGENEWITCPCDCGVDLHFDKKADAVTFLKTMKTKCEDAVVEWRVARVSQVIILSSTVDE